MMLQQLFKPDPNSSFGIAANINHQKPRYYRKWFLQFFRQNYNKGKFEMKARQNDQVSVYQVEWCWIINVALVIELHLFCVENNVKGHNLLNMNKTGQTHETDLVRCMTIESVETERDYQVRKIWVIYYNGWIARILGDSL